MMVSNDERPISDDEVTEEFPTDFPEVGDGTREPPPSDKFGDKGMLGRHSPLRLQR